MAKSDVTLVIDAEAADSIRNLTQVIAKIDQIERSTRRSSRAQSEHKRSSSRLEGALQGVATKAIAAGAGFLTMSGASRALQGLISALDDIDRKVGAIGDKANEFQLNILGLASVTGGATAQAEARLAVAQGARLGVKPQEAVDASARAISLYPDDKLLQAEAREAIFLLQARGVSSEDAQNIVTSGAAARFKPLAAAGKFLVSQAPAALTPAQQAAAFPAAGQFRDVDFGLAAAAFLSKENFTPEELGTGTAIGAKAFNKATAFDPKKFPGLGPELFPLSDLERLQRIVGLATPTGEAGRFVPEDFSKIGFNRQQEQRTLAGMANQIEGITNLIPLLRGATEGSVAQTFNEFRRQNPEFETALQVRRAEAEREAAISVGPAARAGQAQRLREERRKLALTQAIPTIVGPEGELPSFLGFRGNAFLEAIDKEPTRQGSLLRLFGGIAGGPNPLNYGRPGIAPAIIQEREIFNNAIEKGPDPLATETLETLRVIEEHLAGIAGSSGETAANTSRINETGEQVAPDLTPGG